VQAALLADFLPGVQVAETDADLMRAAPLLLQDYTVSAFSSAKLHSGDCEPGSRVGGPPRRNSGRGELLITGADRPHVVAIPHRRLTSRSGADLAEDVGDVLIEIKVN
jgi:hypothetical protein